MINLNFNAACEAGVEISDAQGELRDYAIKAMPKGLSIQVYQLTRLDSQDSYRVAQETPHHWFCDCPSFFYRKVRSSVCKHIRCCQQLSPKQRTLLESLITIASQP